mmetsp:Transcript_40031/g.100167  ORF Transcript_40031/g.100167 Transcript_40031/m.100167 type:complete len:250 (+) Transcript_40031:110-859(+)
MWSACRTCQSIWCTGSRASSIWMMPVMTCCPSCQFFWNSRAPSGSSGDSSCASSASPACILLTSSASWLRSSMLSVSVPSYALRMADIFSSNSSRLEYGPLFLPIGPSSLSGMTSSVQSSVLGKGLLRPDASRSMLEGLRTGRRRDGLPWLTATYRPPGLSILCISSTYWLPCHPQVTLPSPRHMMASSVPLSMTTSKWSLGSPVRRPSPTTHSSVGCLSFCISMAAGDMSMLVTRRKPSPARQTPISD